MNETRLEKLTRRLQLLEPRRLEIVDESARHKGHAGAADGRGHFAVLVVSDRFSDLPQMRRHRLIYEAVGDLMTTDIHALSIRAFAPDEPLPD